MTNGWGGARPEAGRKPVKEKRKPYSFRLTVQEHKVVKGFIQKLKEEAKMTHEEMMDRAWRFIEEVGITEDKAAHQKDNALILVENVHQVRDAYYSDLENSVKVEDEDVCGFLDRHGIKWE